MERFHYPTYNIDVLSIDEGFDALYACPPGFAENSWSLTQVQYLQVYLSQIGCKSMIIEEHYIDRVFMRDSEIYYVRSLRSYPNFTKRVHFFDNQFDNVSWKIMLQQAGRGEHSEIQDSLQTSYLGFTVIRPLPESPVGRTVLPANFPRAPKESVSYCGTTRRHNVHLAGISLYVDGVPFQSQDQGVSACATTALWSALDSVASREEITVSSPASITESATRYPLQEGRPFPNEGLTVRQICEATRAAGFSPLVIPGKSIADDALQIFGYTRSGFAPVLALVPTIPGESGHAVCCVGLRIGSIKPQTDLAISFREASTSLTGLYIHDDRLGPYAYAGLTQITDPESGQIRTCISIEWPDDVPNESWLLHALVVPVPQKLRLTISRMRRLGLVIAETIGKAFMEPQTTLDCHFELSRNYTKRLYTFGLFDNGLYQAICETVLSRYIGLIEITGPAGPIVDIVVDTTEANPESAALACIRRSACPSSKANVLEAIARHLGLIAIV